MMAVFRARVRDAISAEVEGFVEAAAAGRAGGLDFSAKTGKSG